MSGDEPGAEDDPGPEGDRAGDEPSGLRVQIRGIYTTALTELLHDGGFTSDGSKGGEGDERDVSEHSPEVVLASPPIRERFEASFAVDVADATVRTTDDRQGVGVAGTPDAVGTLCDRLGAVALDAFVWEDPAPKGAVFRGVVTETLGSGAVVELGSVPPRGTDRASGRSPRAVEGFLPYDRVDGYVDEGDRYRLQVARPAPPWSDSRPSLATDLRVPGGLVELRRRGGAGDADDSDDTDGSDDEKGAGSTNRPASSPGETARLADLLPVDPPEGWIPRWSRAADDASLETMTAALERAGERAEALMRGIATFESDEPGLMVAPQAGAWVWFGRESRFALDDLRRRVTTTMPGHHRTKAGSEAASAAVDFAETLCEPAGEFPFDVVARQFGPQEGDRIAIDHGKPDGRRIVLGRGEVTELDPAGAVTVEREMSGGGTYDALGVDRVAGDVATTTFTEGRWWYPTVYRSADGERRGTYVNVCTPVEIFPEAVRYVDLHVDVVKGPDGEVRRVDDDELDAAVEAGRVSSALAERARTVAASIESAL